MKSEVQKNCIAGAPQIPNLSLSERNTVISDLGVKIYDS